MHAHKFLNISSIIFISLVVYQIIRQLYAPYWEEISGISYGVITGKPEWLAYQNRLLGPYLIYLISLLGISYISAYKVFVLLSILVQSFTLVVLLKNIGETYQSSINYLIIYSFMYIALQEYSFYSWDNIDAVLFMFFVWGILRSVSPLLFIPLFLVSIFNRESALFIGIYLIIDAFNIEINKSKRINIQLKSVKELILGIILLILGIAYTNLIRELLFISRANGFPDEQHMILGNHFNLEKNLFDLFYENFISMHSANSLFIFGSIGYLLYFVRQYSQPQLKAFIIFICLVLNILVFGIIHETRLYVVLLPFLIFLHQNIKKVSSANRFS
ncbi:MAG TPA: hypothetical protein DHW49_09875 [Anaerolineae bacterium]|nr:hypothetical protein [Anaerolineae bacterium]